MDAKPQRPARSFKIFDENAVPLALHQKTVHSRNKSSPALSALSHVNGLRMAAKRTAFNDLSNIVRTSKDDSTLPAKNGKLNLAMAKNAVVALKSGPKPVSKALKPIETSKQAELSSHPSSKQSELSSQNEKAASRNHSVSVQTVNGLQTETKAQVLEATRLSNSSEPNHKTLCTSTSQASVASNLDGVYLDDDGHVHIYPCHNESTQRSRNAPTRLPPVPEPVETWEEPTGHYEEDYLTARSFRSTDEVTIDTDHTAVFPHESWQTRQEIAIAKDLMNGVKTSAEVEDEAWDTTMVAEYGDEIFQYMRQLELKLLPNPHYMDNQTEVQWSMRSVLVDWIIQVHHRFNLLPETLFLTINYIDRFLSCKIVSLGKLQLVGATAIFVAAKYEEIDCPSVQEIVYMCDGGYTIDEVLKAERFMLTMLSFELGWPGPMSFLRRISKADDYDLETRTLSKYFLEVTIMDERFIGSPPSFLAAGAHCLARLMLRKGAWSTAHVHYSEYTYSQLLGLISTILDCCREPRKHHRAVFDKYMDKRYKRASLYVEAEMRRGSQHGTGTLEREAAIMAKMAIHAPTIMA